MRILSITPIAVDEHELTRRQQRYDRIAPASVHVHLENLGRGSGVPTALETADDVAASEAALLRRYANADAGAYDAYLPDCVLDPVVDHADRLPLPVHGIGRLTAHYLAGLGLRFRAVARNLAIAAELDRKLRSYGIPHAQPTAVMELSVADIADDSTWAAAVQRAVADLDCAAVLNACSAVDVRSASGGPWQVDPTATALRLLGALRDVAR
ncbi:aspartate/glutamate racemase family protein [Qaidamihabitans albus]|uniref:aspartate/glutamate racemase family protein n=1 Tax=Qaidamihabitans albus TaxID=2795733 RepID=UPI0018F17100|nr:aspartate/glutamate racemase family protein [Qaidamihabitans albus]